MKSFLIFLFVLLLALCLCACAGEGEVTELELNMAPIEEDAPSHTDTALQGEWYGYWEMFSSTGAWAEMDKQRWDCCAEISAEDVLYLWDEDMDKDTGLAQLQLSREENLIRVSNGWFMDNSEGCENWRVKLKQDDAGLLLTLRGSYVSSENGDFSFVVYLRPWGDEWPDDRRPETYEKLFYPLMMDGKDMPKNFE